MARVRTLPEALADAAQGDAGFVFAGDHGETTRSYASIYESSRRLARAIRHAGVRSGDLVGILIADGRQFLTTLFSASIAGVIPASLYPPFATSDLHEYLAATA